MFLISIKKTNRLAQGTIKLQCICKQLDDIADYYCALLAQQLHGIRNNIKTNKKVLLSIHTVLVNSESIYPTRIFERQLPLFPFFSLKSPHGSAKTREPWTSGFSSCFVGIGITVYHSETRYNVPDLNRTLFNRVETQ